MMLMHRALRGGNPVAGDVTAPTLSSAVGTTLSDTTATVGATTNEANGTLYVAVTTSATQPSIAQIKAGQNHLGAAAAYASSQAISSTGAKTFTASGLTASTTYYAHLVHTDASSNDSNRLSSASFTTNAASGGTGISAGKLTVVAGSGLGTLADPRPLVYDDFSGGSNGASIDAQAPRIRRSGTYVWDTDGTTPIYSTTTVRDNETYSSRHRMQNGVAFVSSLRYNNGTAWPNTGSVIFASFWINMHQNGSNYSDNFKPIYMYGTNGTEPSMPWGSGGPADSTYRWAAQDGSNSGTNYQGGLGYTAFFDNWGRVDWRVVQSDATNQNGTVDVSAHLPDGAGAVQRWNNTTVRTRSSLSQHFDEVSLGEYANNGSGVDHIVYLSGVYISDTCQRVELSDNATWASRTFSEIQPFDDDDYWTDTEIQCTFKKGRFTTGATAYIFTVDSSNNATYTGQSVTIPS